MMSNRVLIIRAGLIVSVIAFAISISTGCGAATPTGGEFQKETAPSTKTTEQKTVKSTTAGKIEGFEIYENKDPFQPLTGPGSTTRTVTTTTTETETGAGGTTSTTTTTSQAQVRLVSISGGTATINVDGVDHANLKAGDTFATAYKLISIGTGSVTILYGDNQYTLYLGETISVK